MFYLLKRAQVFDLFSFSPLIIDSVVPCYCQTNVIIVTRMQNSLVDFSEVLRVGKSALWICNLPCHGSILAVY